MTRRFASVLVALLVSAAFAVPARAQQTSAKATGPWVTISTPTFVAVANQYAKDLADSTSNAGIWLVQDRTGRIVASGIARPFPTQVRSDDLPSTIPGIRGHTAQMFGMALTPVAPGRRAFRVVYATVE